MLPMLILVALFSCQAGQVKDADVFELIDAKAPRALSFVYLWEFERQLYWEVTQRIKNSARHILIPPPDSLTDTAWPARRDSILESYRRIDTATITEIMSKSVERQIFLEWSKDSSQIIVGSMIEYEGSFDELRNLGDFESISDEMGYCWLEFPLRNLPAICNLESVISIMLNFKVEIPRVPDIRDFIVTPIDSEWA